MNKIFEALKIIIGCAVLGVIFAGLAPLFGYNDVISKHEVCYMATERDDTVQVICAVIGMVAGIIFVIVDYLKNRAEDV
jgi:hypothetical protein